MPFCNVKGHLLTCKRACFTTQKGTFYKPLYNHLFINRLQSAKNLVSLYYRLHYNLLFVRYFLNTENTIFFFLNLSICMSVTILIQINTRHSARKKGLPIRIIPSYLNANPQQMRTKAICFFTSISCNHSEHKHQVLPQYG